MVNKILTRLSRSKTPEIAETATAKAMRVGSQTAARAAKSVVNYADNLVGGSAGRLKAKSDYTTKLHEGLVAQGKQGLGSLPSTLKIRAETLQKRVNRTRMATGVVAAGGLYAAGSQPAQDPYETYSQDHYNASYL